MKSRRLLRHLLTTLLAANLMASLVHAEGVSVEAANKAQVSAATDLYERGVVAFDAGKATEALTQFQRSSETVNSPNSRMMLGRTLVKLGRLPEAYRELWQAIKLAGGANAPQKRYRKTVETAQSELNDIKDQLAYVTLKFAATATIQGQAIAVTSLEEPQAVNPGAVVVVVTFGDGQRMTKELNLKAGEHSELSLQPPAPAASPALPSADATQKTTTPTPTAAPHSERRTFGYVLGAAGILGVSTFVGLEIVASSSYGNTKNSCTAQGCPETAVDKQASKSFLLGVGHAGLGIGILGLGAGTWLLLSSGSKSTPTTSLQVGPLGARVVGSF